MQQRTVNTVNNGHSWLDALLWRVESLHLFRGVLEDETGRVFVALLRALTGVGDGESDASRLYARLFSLLAEEVELSPAPLTGDSWQNHLLERVLSDENPFSRKAEREPLESMGPSLVGAAAADLRTLRSLFLLGGDWAVSRLRETVDGACESLVSWGELRPLASNSRADDPAQLKSRLASEDDWPSLLPELARHYSCCGTGIFSAYRAFRWTRTDGAGRLEGVACPDPVRLEELVEYERERSLLLQITEQFARGFPGNNVLLYGERGTGKSSTIKALLHRYEELGLRLVEVPKGLLGDYLEIIERLRGRRERFILFVDDLSFDEQETSYKDLKAALEGSLEARPENVVVYATSNRRHLVQERFADRMGGDGEIRGQDTHQEKLSLADRFGVTLIFSTPDQTRYLRIVETLARQRGLEVDPGTLRGKALRWATQQAGYSGRTARQFIDYLEGEIGLASGLM